MTGKFMTFTKEELIEKLKEIEAKKADAIKSQQYEVAANFRDKASEIRKQIDDFDNKHSR